MASQGAREALNQAIKHTDRASERAIRVQKKTEQTSAKRARKLSDLKPGDLL
jgi:3-methyladenine DNA glycosylase AlkD